MPIYAYKCNACGFAKDVLQKMSDPVLTQCPTCGQASFSKQVTAAGFQLKGSGWYATDFKGGSAASVAPATPAATEKTASSAESLAAKTDASTSSAAGCGSSCVCHS